MPTGNVWTWPDPQRGDQGFKSPAYDLWAPAADPAKQNDWWGDWNSYQQYQSNEKSWRDYALGGQYNNSLYSFTKQNYDPYSQVKGYAPQSGLTYARIIGDIQGYLDREFPELSDFGDMSQFGQGASSTANLGGEWAQVDSWNQMILSAQAKVQQETGVLVPGNLIKAVMKLESNGVMQDDPYGAIGVMQVMPFWSSTYGDLHDPANNIYAGVSILAGGYKDGDLQGNPSWEWAARRYLGLGGADAYGTTSDTYWNTVSGYMAQLDAAVRGSGGVAGAANYQANQVVEIAKKYVGQVPYVLGGIPGKGVDPLTFGGWDCSGFTYWLDQNYGTGALPQGSHYQYQYAQQTGQLFQNQQQLQIGDLVFFDTGNYSGAGGNLNRAGHVAMYIGNNQVLHAANPSLGTVIGSMDAVGGVFIGAMHASWSGGSAGYGQNGFDAITGGVPYPVTQEIGPTSWSEGDGAWMYGYGAEYGISGHPGVDVGVPLNTSLYAPAAGKVILAGGTPYFTDERYGATPQTGELLIEMANGDQYILGHMSYITVKVGDMVTPGQAVGTSGTYNGAHVHVEYRQLAPGKTSSGYQIVDPRMMFGQFSGQYGQGAKAQYIPGADNWAAFMRATSQGKPVTGYSTSPAGGSFHAWMKQGMTTGWLPAKNADGSFSNQTVAGAWGIVPPASYNQVLQEAIKPRMTTP